ncbi:unnamed protein product [Alopecurus aequalis]
MSSRRRRTRSPALTPLEDDDLLCEILLRIPPQPSSLPRASAVCKRWRGLVSDPGFSRRFRLHHRRNPPLLGFFHRFGGRSFVSTLEPPNCIPPERLSLQRDDYFEGSMSLGCRHGLYLIWLPKPRQVLVWDPITGDKHHIAVPAPFNTENTLVNGAVLRDAGDVQHFQVVVVVVDGSNDQHIQASTCIYSSKTSLWGNLISTPIPYEDNMSRFRLHTSFATEALLAGDSLYWKLAGNLVGILEFDLVKQSLAMIWVPVNMLGVGKSIKIMRAKGGGLGCFVVSESDCTVQLWKRKIDCRDVASWELAKTIEMDKILSLKPEEKGNLYVLGFAEENNAVLMWTMIGLFMIHLDSLKVSRVLVAEMQKWLVGCRFFRFVCFEAEIDPLCSIHWSAVKWTCRN